ncbi:GWxTD domain-containing protein [Gracilimonas sp.]|uniref:GWxTD domain-containing protein n=1 Tax=Gracilimonas sp. TaxID=1974203 RepID=UPI0028715376|nr:GWxTD domain-containing protein [Gracilimonas sp.]
MKSVSRYLFFSLLIILITGCNNEYVDNIDRGLGYNYRPGTPEIRLSSTGIIDPDKGELIIVNVDAVQGSFIYKSKNDSLTANFYLEITILEANNNEVIHRSAEKKVIQSMENSIVNSQKVISFAKEFEVAPGDYKIHVLASDEVSGKETFRETTASIPDKKEETSYITEIRILGKNSADTDNEFNALTLFYIPAKYDSLRFEFQVTNNKADEPADIETRLMKFKYDTTVAKPMHFNNYHSSDISYEGIDYDEYDIVQSSVRMLSQTGTVNLEYNYDSLEKGNYRLEAVLNKGTDREVFKARDFSIKSYSYPSISKADELARPLVYIMTTSEYENLMSLTTNKEIKKAVDRFWLNNIGNSNLAKDVINLYYNRVEEANKQFSNFKEGWKTDLGMVYILFGPPWYVNKSLNEMVWSYTYNTSDPEKNFAFEAPKMNSKFYPFYNYLLQRHSYYYEIQYQQIQNWRSGNILRSRL